MEKILIISTTNRISGAEIVLENYLSTNKKYDYYLFTSSNKEISEFYKNVIESKKIYTSKGMRSFLLKKKPYLIFKYFYSLMISLKQLNKIIKRNKIKVIYGNNSTDVAILILYRIFLNKKIKIISHIHDSLDTTKLPGIYLKLFHNNIDEFIVPSKSTMNYLRKLVGTEKKINVVYNGVNIKDKPNIKKKQINQEIKIGFVGALNSRKRPDIFLKIIKAIKDKNINCKGYLVGAFNKSQYQSISNIINQLNIDADILGTIPHSEIKEFYKEMDCIILTSDKDPLPTVLIEAMSHGTLVAARNVDGVSEIIDDGKDGIVFPFNFIETDVAERVISIILNDNKLNEIIISGFEKVKSKFSNESKRNSMENILDKLD